VTTAADRKTFERVRGAITPVRDVDLVVLFGSRATGRFEPESDIDLAVRSGMPAGEPRRRLEVELARAVGSGADIVFFDEAPPQLRFEIAKSGIVVFEQSPGTWARERARAMVDWWDWAPIARRLHADAVARLRREAL
jgi:predicted nucleotidyltransferase